MQLVFVRNQLSSHTSLSFSLSLSLSLSLSTVISNDEIRNRRCDICVILSRFLFFESRVCCGHRCRRHSGFGCDRQGHPSGRDVRRSWSSSSSYLGQQKNPTRGVVSNGDACDDIGSNKQACEGAGGFCYWYPHSNTFRDPTIGTCSSSAGVSCGNHRAPNCGECPYYDNNDHGYHYCHGDCKWQSHWYDFGQGVCEPR